MKQDIALVAPQYQQQTQAVHAGKRPGQPSVVNSIETASAYYYVDEGEQPYPRYFNTPNSEVVAEQICALENASDGLVFSSGMAAISAALMALLRPGDHVVLQEALYGGTHALVTKLLANYGVEFTFAPSSATAMAEAIQANTKVLYAETPANPLMEIIDLAELADKSRNAGVVSIVDNTFASPINQNPIDHGCDLVVHSGTKYLGGHSDLSFGAVVGNRELVEVVRQHARLQGGNVNALICYLMERSIKTLALRIEKQNTNALELANFLLGLPEIERVFYPGLSSHPGYQVALKQMTGFGGMLSFELASGLSPKKFLRNLHLIAAAMSLGGVESSMTIPALTSHKPMASAERKRLGISERLVRLSTGIESVTDLKSDIRHALKGAKDE